MPRTVTIAVAQLHPRKGDYAANVARVGALLSRLAQSEPRPQVVHLPETVLSGYFVEGGVREVAVTAGTLAADLDAAYRDASHGATRPLDVVAGFYERSRGTLYNAAAYVRLGEGAPRVLHVHRKAFLPTYGLFDEERFVERGHDIRAFDTPWGRAAMLICEDAWHSLSGTIAALDDAEVIFVSSAAPARGIELAPGDQGLPSSVGRWERLVREIAEEHGVFVSLANLVGSEGGKVFAGCSAVMGPHGDLRVRGPAWEEGVVTVSLDLGDIGRARADTPLLADLRTALPHLQRALDAVGGGGAGRDGEGRRSAGGNSTPEGGIAGEPAEEGAGAGVGSAGRSGRSETSSGAGGAPGEGRTEGLASRAEAAPGAEVAGPPPDNNDRADARAGPHHSLAIPIIPPHASPHAAGGPPSLDIDPALVERWLVRFIRDEMARRRFTHAVVGVSGGVDSAVTAFLAARALGAEHVLALRLPYRTSSPESLDHAQLVIDALGVPARTLDISAAVDGYLSLEPDADPTRRGNVMARVRMIALFDQSARLRGVPLGTGNKTERLFGYFTWHADDSPPINPLGDLFKTQVWALARHLGVPEVIVAKPASADLIRGQTDEGDFGISYARADVILNWLISGFSAAELTARGFDADEVALVRRRLDGTHWKRKLPTVAMLTQTAIGESYLRPVDY
jgi:NAD+ synthetase